MADNKKLMILPGDGIGVEVMAEVERIIDWMAQKRGVSFDISRGLVGGAAYDANGTSISVGDMDKAMDADAILFGAVGGPKWDNVRRELRPETGLLQLRKELDLYANFRPARAFDALVDASSLKPDLVSGLDIVIVRELTGGTYFSEPKKAYINVGGTRRSVDTTMYTEIEIGRVVRAAFELARQRQSRVHSVEKANIMETGILWRTVATEIQADYPDITLEHMYADNCAMQLVRNPKQFDVIVTDNLFGDILSDCAAMLTGSLGMLPSAALGAVDENGRRKAMYEPVHGSAPDIQGQGIANPLACILSLAMCLRYSFDRDDDADMIEKAVDNALAQGVRTADIMQDGMTQVSTSGMGDAVLAELDKLV